ncbi:MAG: Kelch repeat-containing protein, partial [Flavisolibacter sp.]
GLTLASAADKIVFAGGMDIINGGGVVANTIDLYSLTTQDWSLSIESPHLDCAVAVSGDKIYFGGGGYLYDTYFSAIDVYDAANNIWGHLSFSEPKTLVAGAAIGDKILFAGGFKKGVDYFPNNIENLVEIYQPATNTWSSVPLSEARGGITSATINNKVYFAGGWNTALSNKIDVYDATTNSWSTSTLRYLPTAKTAIVYGKNIYWTDGSCKVEISNVETGTSSLESLSRSGNVISVVKDNKLVFVRPGSIYFDIYDPSIKAWSVGVLPQQVPGGAAVISVNNTIYVAGGITGSIPMGATTKQIGTNQVWKLEF